MRLTNQDGHSSSSNGAQQSHSQISRLSFSGIQQRSFCCHNAGLSAKVSEGTLYICIHTCIPFSALLLLRNALHFIVTLQPLCVMLTDQKHRRTRSEDDTIRTLIERSPDFNPTNVSTAQNRTSDIEVTSSAIGK